MVSISTVHNDMDTATEGTGVGPSSVYKGSWFRWTRYEIEDGYIVPSRGAQYASYDPWREFWSGRDSKGSQFKPPPYLGLVRLADQLASSEVLADTTGELGDQRVSLTPDAREAVAEWCSRHGLLGLLLSEIDVFQLPIFTTTADNHLAALAHVPIGCEVHESWRYFHQGAEWLIGVDAVALTASPPGKWPAAGALVKKSPLSQPVFRNPDEAWGRYFPRLASKQDPRKRYPYPHGEAFCAEYSESVDDFVRTVFAFSAALELLKPDQSPYGDAANDKADAGRRALESLADTATLALRRLTDGSHEQVWDCPSLLTSYAAMALIDMSEKRRLLSCNSCGRLFVARAWQAGYCTPNCRARALKKRYRASHPKASRGGEAT
jgi:hypothetical protein